MRVEANKDVGRCILNVMEETEDLKQIINKVTDSIFNLRIKSDKVDDFKAHAQSLLEYMKAQGVVNLTIDEMMLITMIQQIVNYHCKDDEELQNKATQAFVNEACLFDARLFSNNAYFNLELLGKSYKNFEFAQDSYAEYELVPYGVAAPSEFISANVLPIGCFAKEFKYPVLLSRDGDKVERVNELSLDYLCYKNSYLQNVKGNVLVLNLQMGYFATLAAEDSRVKSVVVIEENQDLIDMYENIILPQLNAKDKITIIKASPLEFLKNVKNGKYDYILWNETFYFDEAQRYFEIKECDKRLSSAKFDILAEENILSYLSYAIYTRIQRDYRIAEEMSPLKEETDVNIKSRIDDYIDRIYKDVVISSEEDIRNYTSFRTIRAAINNSKEKF